MEKKFNYKKLFLILFIVILVIAIIIIVSKNSKVEEDIPDIEISANAVEDEKVPEDITYINLSTENKILCCYSLGEFSSGQNLTVEQYLQVAYNALNNGYIETNKTSFSEKEINDIVYSIFNVELAENQSIDGLNYENGKYKLEKKDTEKLEMQNFESSTAAGSLYVDYEINNQKYLARLNSNTVTGENYIQSIMKD